VRFHLARFSASEPLLRERTLALRANLCCARSSARTELLSALCFGGRSFITGARPQPTLSSGGFWSAGKLQRKAKGKQVARPN